jgi:inorganic pyrophosphatase
MAKRVFNFNKLVRDKIPQVIRGKGCSVNDYEIVGSELNTALKNKIIEEAQEVVESKSIEALKEELADLLEVISATMSANKINPEEIEKIRSTKNQERGTFSKGVYVSSIEIDEENPAVSYYTARAAQYPEEASNISEAIHTKSHEFWAQLQQLIDNSEILIDRPKNSAHPKYPNFIYPLDYGFLKGSSASDGNEIDIWIGTLDNKKINGILCTVDPIKKDVETKIVYSCTNEEIAAIYSKMNEVLRAIYIPK